MGRSRRGGKKSAAGRARAKAMAAATVGKIGREAKNETDVCAQRRQLGSNGSTIHQPCATNPVTPPRSLRAVQTIHTMRNGPMVPPGVTPIVKELVSVGKLSENLCLFFAVFNTLQDDAKRRALARGNITEPSKAFVEFMHETSTKEQIKKFRRIGFTRADICRFLEYLRELGEIAGFTWRAEPEFTVCALLHGQHAKQYVLLGSAATPIQFNEVKKAVEGGVKEDNRKRQMAKKKKDPIKQQSWEREVGWITSKVPSLLGNRHAIAVIRTEWGEVYYYDNKNRKPRLVERPLDLAAGLAYYDRVVECDLIV